MNNVVRSYRDLQVWQKSRILVSDIYKLSSAFPKEEMYGLTSQMRRAAISIPSNIAEGSSKGSTREYLRFLSIAYGSLCELETQLYLAQDLGFIAPDAINLILEKTNEIGRMINGLSRALEQKLTELRTLNSGLSDAQTY